MPVEHVYDIGNGTYDAEANKRRLQGTRPVKRDTTLLYRCQTAKDACTILLLQLSYKVQLHPIMGGRMYQDVYVPDIEATTG